MKLWHDIRLWLRSKITGFWNRLENRKFSQPIKTVQPKNLLLVKLDSIGDYVLFRNFIASLKTSEKYQSYRITLCGNLWWKDLAETFDKAWVDEFIWIDYQQMNRRTYRWRIYQLLRKKAFEVAIHPTFSRDAISDNVVLYSGAPQKIGYQGDSINLSASLKHRNDQLYTQLVPSAEKFAFEFYRNQFFFQRLLGIKLDEVKPRIDLSSDPSFRIIFCPGAKVLWRRWSPQNFAELANNLKELFPKSDFFVCGSASDSLLAEEMKTLTSVALENKCGKLSLVDLAKLMAGAQLVVTNDSGPFHIAVALNRKTVCISNGNNYGRFSPYPTALNSNSLVAYPEALLQLSAEEERLEKFCREGSTLDINTIEVKTVLDLVRKLLEL